MGTKTMQNIAYYILLNTEVVGQLMDRYDMIGRPRSFVALADELIENERDITDNLDLVLDGCYNCPIYIFLI